MGVVLHGSRSGVRANTTHQEFVGTSNYATVEPNGLSWAVTVGDDEIALHLEFSAWGWHARGYSPTYYGVEFAQSTVDKPISDAQVRAFCYWFQFARAKYPSLSQYFPTHAEIDGTPLYGTYDGKTDVFPRGDPRTDNLRARISARLKLLGVS